MLSLDIKIHSFILSKEIADPNDTIRVSITTIPEMQKEAQTFEIKKIDSAEVSFKINFVGITEKIAIILRKKSLFGNSPIIASTVLRREDLNIYNEFINFENKRIDLYEPIQSNGKKKDNLSNKNRKVVGHFEIDFSLKEEFSKENYIVGNEFYMKYCKFNSLYVNENADPNILITDDVANIESNF